MRVGTTATTIAADYYDNYAPDLDRYGNHHVTAKGHQFGGGPLSRTNHAWKHTLQNQSKLKARGLDLCCHSDANKLKHMVWVLLFDKKIMFTSNCVNSPVKKLLHIFAMRFFFFSRTSVLLVVHFLLWVKLEIAGRNGPVKLIVKQTYHFRI